MNEQNDQTARPMSTAHLMALIEKSSLGGKQARQARSKVDVLRARRILDVYGTDPATGITPTVPEVEPVDDQEVPGGDPPALDPALRQESMLVAYLAESDFSSPEYQVLLENLVSYTVTALDAWVRSGKIFVQVKSFARIDLGPTEAERTMLRVDRYERHGLVNDTVAEAARLFDARAMRRGEWKPARGVSLRTFFTGGAILNFPGQYRRWRRYHANDAVHLSADDRARLATHPSLDSAEIVASGSELETVLQDLNSRDRQILRMTSAGYTDSEIADHLELSSTQVIQEVLGRVRRRIAEKGRTASSANMRDSRTSADADQEPQDDVQTDPGNEVRFFTVTEVAELMRVSKMTVYRLVHSGEIAAVRMGRSFRVPESAVQTYLGSLEPSRTAQQDC